MRKVDSAVIAIVLAALGACSATPVSHHSASASLCPTRPPPLGWSGGSGPSTDALVPGGATSLVDCTYNSYGVIKGAKQRLVDPVHGVVVDESLEVASYAELLADAATPRCARSAGLGITDQSSPSDVLLWSYPSGETWALARGGRCSAVAGPDGHAVTPTFEASTLLVGLSAAIEVPQAGERPAPALIGMSLPQALAAHHDLAVVGELHSHDDLIGTVMLTDPPAGVQMLPGVVGIVVAVHRVPGCRAANLRGSASTGEPGAGTSFSRLTLRDVGVHACSLHGRIQVEALGSNGRLLARRVIPVSSGGPDPLVLVPAAETGKARYQSALTASAILSSTDYTGNCTSGYSLVDDWRVILLAGHRSSTVADIPSQERPPGNEEVIVCGGRFGAGPFSLAGLFEP